MPVAVPTMSVAHEARSIAEGLIPSNHPHLLTASILYVFTDQKRKRCDRIRLGSAAKMSSLQRFLASGLDGVEQGPTFVIQFDSNEWRDMNRPARTALVDHELCHCALFVKDADNNWLRWTPDMDDPQDFADQRWGMRAHDIEEFSEVLARHGFWKPAEQERKFFEAVNLQLTMPESNGKLPKPPKRENA